MPTELLINSAESERRQGSVGISPEYFPCLSFPNISIRFDRTNHTSNLQL
ncbi:MAG: hypothetical protein ACR2LR_08775 [Hassallia sp.]